MLVFLYEYITGGGLWTDQPNQPPSESLLVEGSALWRALAADLTAIPAVEVVALHDRRLPAFELPGCRWIEVSSADEERVALCRAASEADATLLIAPETGGVLAQRARQVLSAGGRLLSPSLEFIELAADKHRSAELLRAAGIAAPRGILRSPGEPLPADFHYPAVLKPVDGAGSCGVRLVESSGHTSRAEAEAGDRHTARRLEQFYPGLAISMAVLAGPAANVLLPGCYQILSKDGSFSYQGGKTPLPPVFNARSRRLVESCLAVLPAATGYIGFDLILGVDASGADDVVIEINPRLTTSYVGLRALARSNLAAAMLQIAGGGCVELSFSAGPIEFRATGELVA